MLEFCLPNKFANKKTSLLNFQAKFKTAQGKILAGCNLAFLKLKTMAHTTFNFPPIRESFRNLVEFWLLS